MDPVTGAIVSNVAGELLGGLFGSNSAKKQNKAAIAAQEAANAFTEKQLQNRHQWEVDDLRKAGLNPILSAGGTPSIGGSSAAPVVGETEHFANSAKNIGKAPLERQLAMAQLKNIESQTSVSNATASGIQMDNLKKGRMAPINQVIGRASAKAATYGNKFFDRASPYADKGVEKIEKLLDTPRNNKKMDKIPFPKPPTKRRPSDRRGSKRN